MSEGKKVKITINGKEIEADSRSSIFQAAAHEGIFVPHYCYHPDLSVAGVCRMCLVEIEKFPKLQVSCNTPVTEGMVIHTNSAKVKDAVKGVLELHLINHPLDCPICDKAGECKLQDFYVDYGLYQSRMEFDKVHKPKVVDIGKIILDAERCILCTRCVRFTAEVTKTHELGIFNRGDRSELKTYDDGPLRNDYTGNLADICPVGALTAKDFRFQCRVWFLEKTDSICTLCARGCNTTISVNPQTKNLHRVEPRRNPEVNKSWICDTGRWDYHYVYSESRVKTPKQKSDGVWSEMAWNSALDILHAEIERSPERVLVGVSTQMTNEEMVDVVLTLKLLGIERFMWVADEETVGEKEPWDHILKHRDPTANAAGFVLLMEALGIETLKYDRVSKLVEGAEIDWCLLLGLEGERPEWCAKWLSVFPETVKLVVHATNDSSLFERAQMLLPNVSSYEKSGTVINALGKLQRLNAAIPPRYTARDGHKLVFGVGRGNDREKAPANRSQQLFEAIVSKKLTGDEASV